MTPEQIEEIISLGLRILPTIDKKSVLKDWPNTAPSEPEQIRELFAKHPTAQPAAIVPNDIIILDLDPRNGGSLEALEAVTGPLPDTLTSWSGRGDGGRHLWFKKPATEISQRQLPKGVDLRKPGVHYVVIPPALHNETGKPYAWNDVPFVAELPQQAVDALAPPKPKVTLPAPVSEHPGNLTGLVRSVSEAVEGERNEKLFWASCRAFDHGDDAVIQDLFEAALSVGLTESEASSTIDSARRTERQQPEPFIPNGNFSPPVGNPTPAKNFAPEPEAVAVLTQQTESPMQWHDANLRSHQRIAARLTQYADGKALYVDGIGWHYWSGTHWALDHRETRIHAILSDLLQRSWLEAMNDQALQSDVKSAMTATGSRGVIDLASRSPELFTAQVDQDPYLLNCTNGTLDLHTLQLRPHDPADRITKITGAGYDPNAAASSWESFLASSLPDPAVRAFMQRYAGLSLIGRVIEHVMLIATGTGRNGKGVLARTLSKALGDYAVTATNDLLVTGRHGGKTAGELAAQMVLRGARFAVMSELDKNDKMNESLMKSLTGGDEITAKLMGQNFVSFMPSHSFFLQTNDLPAMDAGAEAAWSRVRVVPFDVSFKGREDHRLEERLEIELSGVLTWAVEGLRAYQQTGLDEPDAVRASTDAYRSDNDALSRFIADRCVLNPAASVATSKITEAYNQWAALNGEQPVSSRALGKDLRELDGITDKRTNSGRGLTGIGLTHDEG